MVYGLSNPPHTSQTVSIAISQELIQWEIIQTI
jgi:hypothetical protein